MTTTTLWRYDDPTWAEIDLVGYAVEAVDGEIGRVDAASEQIGARYLVVDTGPWIFGRQVMLPAGLVERVDVANERVHVRQTREHIKKAPHFNLARHHDPRYREALSVYYGPSRLTLPRTPRDNGRMGSTFEQRGRSTL
jgi:hypothetical protein